MSELRSAIEALRAEVLAELPDARVEADLDELTRAAEMIELERLRRIAEIDRRGSWARDGYLSVTAWVADRHRTDRGTARDQVRTARALGSMPLVRDALIDGRVSMSAARVLARAHEAHPEPFTQTEDAFVEAAGRHRVGELRRITGAWCDRRSAEADADRGLSPEEGRRARRRLHASVTFGGMVRLDGDLDPETGETVLTALGAVLDAEARSRTDEDVRTPAQRRADALGEICRGWLDRDDRPTVAGERPHVSLIVDLVALRSTDDRRLDREVDDPFTREPVGLAHTGAAIPELLRRFTCDASVARVVLGPGSEPLDVGRRTPVVPPAIRRAVVVRDRGCRFPGCDRPPGWCDAHHVQHWADGGPTSLANLVLLCRRHHRLVHARGGCSLTLEHGRPMFRRPDGTVLGGDDRAPP